MTTNGSVFYHVSSNILGEGSIIMPGNWGRMLMWHTTLTDAQFRERIFELVRLQHFADKPSRLSCVFAVETAEQAARYQATVQPSGLIYEVCVDDGNFAKHRGFYNFSMSPDRTPIQRFYDLAHRYWSEEPTECIEVLIQAPVRIMRCLG